jgi:hypothetical protein
MSSCAGRNRRSKLFSAVIRNVIRTFIPKTLSSDKRPQTDVKRSGGVVSGWKYSMKNTEADAAPNNLCKHRQRNNPMVKRTFVTQSPLQSEPIYGGRIGSPKSKKCGYEERTEGKREKGRLTFTAMGDGPSSRRRKPREDGKDNHVHEPHSDNNDMTGRKDVTGGGHDQGATRRQSQDEDAEQEDT